MTDADRPMRRLVFAADVQRYSGRATLDQIDAQAAFVEVLDGAAAAAGLDRGLWERQPQGDGEFAVLPSDVDEPAVIADFVRELGICLARHNRSRKRELRLRLRVAMHFGVLHAGANGYPGRAPIIACRLLDAQPVKDVLTAVDDADLALVVSGDLYRDIVEPGYRGLRPDEFHRIGVAVKEYTGDGYVRLHGYPVTSWLAATPISIPAPGDVSAPGGASAATRHADPEVRTGATPMAGGRPDRRAQYDFGGAQIRAVSTGAGDAVGGDKVSNTFHDTARDAGTGCGRGDDDR